MTDFSHERSITSALMKAVYSWKERMSVRLLSNREEERRSHNGRPYSTGSCWPIGGSTSLSLLTGLLVFAESFPNSTKHAEGHSRLQGSIGLEMSDRGEVSTFKSKRFGQPINGERVTSLSMGQPTQEGYLPWCMPHNPRGSRLPASPSACIDARTQNNLATVLPASRTHKPVDYLA